MSYYGVWWSPSIWNFAYKMIQAQTFGGRPTIAWIILRNLWRLLLGRCLFLYQWQHINTKISKTPNIANTGNEGLSSLLYIEKWFPVSQGRFTMGCRVGGIRCGRLITNVDSKSTLSNFWDLNKFLKYKKNYLSSAYEYYLHVILHGCSHGRQSRGRHRTTQNLCSRNPWLQLWFP